MAVRRFMRPAGYAVIQYGAGRWRKRKGLATVRLADGTVRRAELHWYEATGVGQREFQIKRYVE